MIGLIGGTGLGEALLGENAGTERVVQTPFGKPSGPIRICDWHGLELAILARHGDGHVFNPSCVPYRANIYALKSLGVTHIIASGAVGSLREDYKPRDLAIVDQVIDKTYRRTPTFFDQDIVTHVEFSRPYCDELRKLLISVASKIDTDVHDSGTYVCMEGPAFSAVAEAKMHQQWGGDLIGMTTMPEAKLAREAEISYALIALITDYDCWKPHDPNTPKQKLLEEIIGHLQAATRNAIALMRAAIEKIASSGLPDSPAHTALDLAVWSDCAKITPAVRGRYGVLLDRFLATAG
ncbi:MAG: S-methyl-5'-thioadenosine phosphorylase [Phycisphaerae bacterium]|nr:S-methyl-5'-thioadenosine phosphorylase [Phycisphaerae bacterium]